MFGQVCKFLRKRLRESPAAGKTVEELGSAYFSLKGCAKSAPGPEEDTRRDSRSLLEINLHCRVHTYPSMCIYACLLLTSICIPMRGNACTNGLTGEMKEGRREGEPEDWSKQQQHVDMGSLLTPSSAVVTTPALPGRQSSRHVAIIAAN